MDFGILTSHPEMEGAVNVNSGSKRGRKPGRSSNSSKNQGDSSGLSTGKGDMKAKLERSRQSARECRARKKLRYQYLEELVAHRERAVVVLRKELEQYRQWCHEMDEGRVPDGIQRLLEDVRRDRDLQAQMNQLNASQHTPRPADAEMSDSPS